MNNETIKHISDFALRDLAYFLASTKKNMNTNYLHIHDYINPDIYKAINAQMELVENELTRRDL